MRSMRDRYTHGHAWAFRFFYHLFLSVFLVPLVCGFWAKRAEWEERQRRAPKSYLLILCWSPFVLGGDNGNPSSLACPILYLHTQKLVFPFCRRLFYSFFYWISYFCFSWVFLRAFLAFDGSPRSIQNRLDTYKKCTCTSHQPTGTKHTHRDVTSKGMQMMR